MAAGVEKLIVRRVGHVGWLQFNNPSKYNAITVGMAENVPRVMAELDADPHVRVIVVSGVGQRAFAAGSDISGFGEFRADSRQNQRYHDLNEDSYNAVYACLKPTIAMIHGYCIGGGVDFAASCDIRICSDDAVFSVPAVRLGLGYGYEGHVRISRVVGAMRAREILLSGRRFSAQEVFHMGFVNEVVQSSELEGRVTDYADSLAEGAPLTIRAIKQAFIELEKEESVRDMTGAQDAIDRCFESEDYQEGRNAFSQKRRPDFTGR